MVHMHGVKVFFLGTKQGRRLWLISVQRGEFATFAKTVAISCSYVESGEFCLTRDETERYWGTSLVIRGEVK